MSRDVKKDAPVAATEVTEAEAEVAEVAEAAKTEGEAKVGAPTTTPNETIAEMLPETRIARSAALKIVRDQGIKCSQERMTVIMEGKYGAAPTAEEKAKERAEAKAIKDAEKAKAREAKKVEREAAALAKRAEKEEAAKAKAESKAAESKDEATDTKEKPAV